MAATYRDVDSDGDVDLVVEFSTKEIIAKGDLPASATSLVFQGKRNDGRSLRAVETVTIVP